MLQWYKKVVFENYANFTGRARRSEYWYFVLTNFLIQLPFLILAFVFFAVEKFEFGFIFYGLLMLYALALIIPSLAVAVRRLHDVGKSGWFYFVAFIPLVGAIWLLVLFFTEGDKGNNQYGSDPKQIDDIQEIGTN